MRIAIIGGGFAGLSCALSLAEKGVEVTVYESKKTLGGLAGGIKNNDWKWSLEFFYHHVFTNDKHILDLAKKVGVTAIKKDPLTTSFLNKREWQLDSPISVLKFSELSIWQRVQMGIGLAVLKAIPNGLFLEKYRVVDVLPKLIGKKGYQVIWERLLRAKFGPFTDKVNMAWFWTRVAKRTKQLIYFEEGFQNLADNIANKIRALGGEIILGKEVSKIKKGTSNKWIVDGVSFDGVVMTTPAPIAKRILDKEVVSLPEIPHLWGQTVILELNKRIINGYWMNILEKDWPFLVAVEHTNLINKKYYGDNGVLYLGNYLQENDVQLKMSKEQLISLYLPYLKKINHLFEKDWIIDSSVFREPFAQPVFPLNYSRVLPSIKTKERGLFLANMSMVYPFDRGTNYAVKMGNEVAKLVLSDLR